MNTRGLFLERVTGFEPVVSTLGKLHVTATPNPHIDLTRHIVPYASAKVKRFCKIALDKLRFID